MRPVRIFEINRNQRGQTAMEALLLMAVAFIVFSFVFEKISPRLRSDVIDPMKNAMADTIRFGVTKNGPIPELEPETDDHHPFQGRRSKPLHLN